MFKNDKDMPVFSVLEGEAAARYLNIAIDVAKGQKMRLQRIRVNGTDMPMAQAEQLRDEYYDEFTARVENETRRKNPNATQGDVAERICDILHCFSDTGYVSPKRQSPHTR